MSQKLVAYFSCSGVSKYNAELFAKILKCDIYEIKPKVAYTNADLDWTDKNSRSTKEMADKKFRPEIADKNAALEKYNEIVLIFPIWWYVAPTIVNTFLEAYDFKNKRIILFPTSGSSNFGKTVEELKVSVDATTKIEKGVVAHSKSNEKEVEEWVKKYNL